MRRRCPIVKIGKRRISASVVDGGRSTRADYDTGKIRFASLVFAYSLTGSSIPSSTDSSCVSPYFVEVPDNLKSASFIEKDSKRFPDTSDGDMPNFRMTQRLTGSSLSEATVHSERKFVTSAIRL